MPGERAIPGALRGRVLDVAVDGSVRLLPASRVAWDEQGRFTASAVPAEEPVGELRVLCPPFFDLHTHIPQHPVRGRFLEGICGGENATRLLQGLQRNIFPEEIRCGDPSHARKVVEQFAVDVLRNGVLGGSAYMTVHAHAVREALLQLPASWLVGMVLMDRNCPPDLQTRTGTLEDDYWSLHRDFGHRLVMTDRFAVAVSGELRARGVALADRFGSRIQTHLNEQESEKRVVERELYPDAGSYTRVYDAARMLRPGTILAHCVHNSAEEMDLIASRGAIVAHCPSSNLMLGSGIMPIRELLKRGIRVALCTDVAGGASQSLLAEMVHFLRAHRLAGVPVDAREALYRCTILPAAEIGLQRKHSWFEAGSEATFLELELFEAPPNGDCEVLIDRGLLGSLAEKVPDDVAEAIRALARGCGVADEPLRQLTRDARKVAAALEGRVTRAWRRGNLIFERDRA
jgi:guanine deaminase